MQPFEHFSPKNLTEALELLEQENGRTQVIAGGTDLMLKMRAGILEPSKVINIKGLEELKGLSYDSNEGLTLGALTTLRALTRTSAIRESYPSLAHAAYLMASEQIRSFATVGGNLCNAAPSADLAPPLIALKAQVHLVSLGGERQIPLEEFFLGPGISALQPGELLKEIRVPPPVGRTIYLKHSARAFMDIAMVGVGIGLEIDHEVCEQARIVLGAVAPVPLRAHSAEEALIGEPVTEGQIILVAKAAADACAPIDDVRGAAWYRRRMVDVLVRRGLANLTSNGKGQ